jgi:hypothetical protein
MSKIVLSYFDYTGEAVQPWADAGYTCYCYDHQHPMEREPSRATPNGGRIHKVYADLSDPEVWRAHALVRQALAERDPIAFIFGFPPCTDLAASGARHWKSKAAKDPDFQTKAVWMAEQVETLGKTLGVPYCIENPVGALSTLYRKPDYRFDPCDFGGYLQPDEAHPIWPEYIPPQDAYRKRTCLWTGGGFRMPDDKPVEPVVINTRTSSGSPAWAKLGGKSLKTKNIRSATPRGFARAVFEFNANMRNDAMDKAYFEIITFDCEPAAQFLATGETHALEVAFIFNDTAEGHDYWAEYVYRGKPVDAQLRAKVQAMVDAFDALNKPSGLTDQEAA